MKFWRYVNFAIIKLNGPMNEEFKDCRKEVLCELIRSSGKTILLNSLSIILTLISASGFFRDTYFSPQQKSTTLNFRDIYISRFFLNREIRKIKASPKIHVIR